MIKIYKNSKCNEQSMNIETALRALSELDNKGRYVYTSKNLATVFWQDQPSTLNAGISRLVKYGILKRATRGVYLYAYSRHIGIHTIDLIAKSLRRGHYNYISLESALSLYGAISQVPIDRLTVMTTGREEEFATFFGVIEFTHTKRSSTQIAASVVNMNQPLRVANQASALRDLKRAGRNLHLVEDSSEHE